VQTKESNFYDLAIVGGGIVGLATARELMLRYPGMKLVLLEKESSLGKTTLYYNLPNSGLIKNIRLAQLLV
jgi:2-hydroxyglutarate dehydrogenase